MSCHKPVHPKDQIRSIEIATSGCLRNCPVVAVRIDSSLVFKYHGGYKAKLKGYYSGTISQGFWDTLNVKLKQINFKKLDTTPYYGLDGEQSEVIFYWESHKKHISKSIDDTPDEVSNVLTWVLNSYKHIPLYKTKDTIGFESRFINIRPPLLKKDSVKFPPPAQ
jgi:Domain of unknown function (DUF6438)